MKKVSGFLVTTIAMMSAMTLASFAGSWGQSNDKWYYLNDDGSYAASGWQWIDGDNNGVSECYYFDANGCLLVATVTPDGYTVNGNGAWIDATGNAVTKVLTAGGDTANGNQTQTYDGTVYEYNGLNSDSTTLNDIWAQYSSNGYNGSNFINLYNGGSYSNTSSSNLYSNDEEDEEDEETTELTDKELYNLLSGSYKYSKDPSKNCSEDETLEKMVEYVNILRKKKGLDELEMGDTLMEAAAIRAEELSEKYDHTRPDGSECFTVLDELGVDESVWAGENIAQGQSSAMEVTNGWYHSSGHKANIMKKRFTRIGVGMYNDHGTKNWVQLFTE